MHFRVIKLWVLISALSFLAPPAFSTTITLDFEGLTDGTLLNSTYVSQGITFTNASAITAGISLNEIDFPPHSGENVATDSGGAVTISFATDIVSFSGYFTYATPLQIAAYDNSNSLVDSATSVFDQNFASSGNPPNELIQISYASGIQSLTITGDPAGGSFVMDDLSFSTTAAVPNIVPEPAFFSLWGLGFAAAIITKSLVRPAKRQ